MQNNLNPLITLCSDYGRESHYLYVLKKQLLKQIPQASVEIVNVDIESFDIQSAAYILHCAIAHSNVNTIHLVLIGEHFASPSHIKNLNHWLSFECHNQFIICPDNGFITLFQNYLDVNTCRRFQAQDEDIPAYVQAIKKVVSLGYNENFGELCTNYKVERTLNPYQEGSNQIGGYIIRMDKFGIGISNIPFNMHHNFKKGRNTRLRINNNIKINKIINNFGELSQHDEGAGFAMFNQFGYLEVGIFNGAIEHGQSAAQLWGLNIGDKIIIEYY